VRKQFFYFLFFTNISSIRASFPSGSSCSRSNNIFVFGFDFIFVYLKLV